MILLYEFIMKISFYFLNLCHSKLHITNLIFKINTNNNLYEFIMKIYFYFINYLKYNFL